MLNCIVTCSVISQSCSVAIKETVTSDNSECTAFVIVILDSGYNTREPLHWSEFGIMCYWGELYGVTDMTY